MHLPTPMTGSWQKPITHCSNRVHIKYSQYQESNLDSNSRLYYNRSSWNRKLRCFSCPPWYALTFSDAFNRKWLEEHQESRFRIQVPGFWNLHNVVAHNVVAHWGTKTARKIQVEFWKTSLIRSYHYDMQNLASFTTDKEAKLTGTTVPALWQHVSSVSLK